MRRVCVRRMLRWRVCGGCGMQRACGVGSPAAVCETRRVALPAMRGEPCCCPRGVSKAASTTHPPALPGARNWTPLQKATVPEQSPSTGCPPVYSRRVRRRSRCGCGSRCVPTSPRRGDAAVAAVVIPANLGTSAEFGVPVTSQRGPARKPGRGTATTHYGPVRWSTGSRVGVAAPTNACAAALRARKLARRGAGALGERGGALGERRVCAVCGARRATWCVRGVLRGAWRVAHRVVRW